LPVGLVARHWKASHDYLPAFNMLLQSFPCSIPGFLVGFHGADSIRHSRCVDSQEARSSQRLPLGNEKKNVYFRSWRSLYAIEAQVREVRVRGHGSSWHDIHPAPHCCFTRVAQHTVSFATK
jgi:hypothetical protein